MGGQLIQAGPGRFGPDQLHQFHLLELMLANHAPGVLPVAAGLAAEAGRVADMADGQRIPIENQVPVQVGDRHFAGGNEVQVAAFDAELIGGELGQLARAVQGLRVDYVGGIDLGVAVLVDVGVQHELGQGPVQAHQGALHHHEAGAGYLRRGGEVQGAGGG